MTLWESLAQGILEKDRYLLYLDGLGVTLSISLGAIIVGLVLGLIIALVRVGRMSSDNIFIKIADAIVRAYVAIFRGTPVAVQIMIFAFVIFAQSPLDRIWVAIIAFGCNSGAYVSETIRAGIMAVDFGQTEAGRSLGLSNGDTYRYIVLPQAFKNVLPPLGNEAIMLVKETAIVSMIAVVDLTKAAYQIANETYAYMVPLLFIALVYFIIVWIMNFGLRRLERRLRRSDQR